MATDPRKLRPSELCRLLNSTPLGEVINERQLHRHRTRAGMRIGDGRFVDLLRYTAWLVETRHTPKPEPDGDPYEKLKERARARNAALAAAGRDIGELPAVVDSARKGKLERWHGSIKRECIRPAAISSLAEARHKVAEYVEHYNEARLHSAIGYVTPADKLAGLEKVIFAERDRKLEEARARRQQRRQAARKVA